MLDLCLSLVASIHICTYQHNKLNISQNLTDWRKSSCAHEDVLGLGAGCLFR